MTDSLRECLGRRPFVKLHNLKTPLSGVLLSREIFDEKLFYIIEQDNGVLVKLIESADLAKKMDPINEGDCLTIQFKGWLKTKSGFSMQIADVSLGREI
ncbi:MAG: hypothetical protein AB7O96_10035 [Pseudobdellovibrionaceae bacterium]